MPGFPKRILPKFLIHNNENTIDNGFFANKYLSNKGDNIVSSIKNKFYIYETKNRVGGI